MRIDPKGMVAGECYKLMTGVIVPRPIAWVTTVSDAGVVNLAPFSHFTFVCPKPPMVALSFGKKGDAHKDTAQNIMRSEEFVVHIAHTGQVDALHQSGIEFPADESETEALGLATRPSEMVKPPRLVDARIALECRLRHFLELGDTRNRLVIGEVVLIHVDDAVTRDGKIETKLLDPLCRLAGPHYAGLGDLITMKPIARTLKT